MRTRQIAMTAVCFGLLVFLISCLAVAQTTLNVLRTDSNNVIASTRTEADVPNENPDIDEPTPDSDTQLAERESVSSTQNAQGSTALAQMLSTASVNTAQNQQTTLAKAEVDLGSIMAVMDSTYGNSYAACKNTATNDIASAVAGFEPQNAQAGVPITFADGALNIVINGTGTDSNSNTTLYAYVEPHFVYATNNGNGVYTVWHIDYSESIVPEQLGVSGTSIDVSLVLDGLEWYDYNGDGDINIYAEATQSFDRSPKTGGTDFGQHNYTYQATGWFVAEQ